ncbi:hypothetical protein PR048_009733 [Dryococelus australis]|uniref:Uncharacterized protein n=1 Tax=Dryococelus australis TaxID=614101 RepID=A0ABQ9I0P6_9NEOP|nr:hypothetical protein PR048_009733 [Dryococelus australis]
MLQRQNEGVGEREIPEKTRRPVASFGWLTSPQSPCNKIQHRIATESSVDDTLVGPDGSAVVMLEGAGTRNEVVFVERDVAPADGTFVFVVCIGMQELQERNDVPTAMMEFAATQILDFGGSQVVMESEAERFGRRSEVSMEQRLNARAGETGESRENPLTSCIVWHDSYLQKSGHDSAASLYSAGIEYVPICLERFKISCLLLAGNDELVRHEQDICGCGPAPARSWGQSEWDYVSDRTGEASTVLDWSEPQFEVFGTFWLAEEDRWRVLIPTNNQVFSGDDGEAREWFEQWWNAAVYETATPRGNQPTAASTRKSVSELNSDGNLARRVYALFTVMEARRPLASRCVHARGTRPANRCETRDDVRTLTWAAPDKPQSSPHLRAATPPVLRPPAFLSTKRKEDYELIQTDPVRSLQYLPGKCSGLAAALVGKACLLLLFACLPSVG